MLLGRRRSLTLTPACAKMHVAPGRYVQEARKADLAADSHHGVASVDPVMRAKEVVELGGGRGLDFLARPGGYVDGSGRPEGSTQSVANPTQAALIW